MLKLMEKQIFTILRSNVYFLSYETMLLCVSDVCITCTEDGDANLKYLEGSSVKVTTDRGNCTCKSVKVIHY